MDSRRTEDGRNHEKHEIARKNLELTIDRASPEEFHGKIEFLV
jgi:hypothetical protein